MGTAETPGAASPLDRLDSRPAIHPPTTLDEVARELANMAQGMEVEAVGLVQRTTVAVRSDPLGAIGPIKPGELEAQPSFHSISEAPQRVVIVKPVREDNPRIIDLAIEAIVIDALSDPPHRLTGPAVQFRGGDVSQLIGQGVVAQGKPGKNEASIPARCPRPDLIGFDQGHPLDTALKAVEGRRHTRKPAADDRDVNDVVSSQCGGAASIGAGFDGIPAGPGPAL
jgi:hypothetical protein